MQEFLTHNRMIRLFCDCCGDEVKAVYPCRFVFSDGSFVPVNVCLDCMENESLEIPLARKRLVAKILGRLSAKEKWRRRIT